MKPERLLGLLWPLGVSNTGSASIPRFGRAVARVRTRHLKSQRKAAARFLCRALATESNKLDCSDATTKLWIKEANLKPIFQFLSKQWSINIDPCIQVWNTHTWNSLVFEIRSNPGDLGCKIGLVHVISDPFKSWKWIDTSWPPVTIFGVMRNVFAIYGSPNLCTPQQIFSRQLPSPAGYNGTSGFETMQGQCRPEVVLGSLGICFIKKNFEKTLLKGKKHNFSAIFTSATCSDTSATGSDLMRSAFELSKSQTPTLFVQHPP